MSKISPRGIRNNNPLNIRIGNNWLGEVRYPSDPEFEQFVSMDYGIRAAFVILRRYIRRYHKNTIQQIISTWAPRSENDTDNYVKVVSKLSQIDPDTPIEYEDKQTMISIVDAMIRVECGCQVDRNKIEMGYNIA